MNINISSFYRAMSQVRSPEYQGDMIELKLYDRLEYLISQTPIDLTKPDSAPKTVQYQSLTLIGVLFVIDGRRQYEWEIKV